MGGCVKHLYSNNIAVGVVVKNYARFYFVAFFNEIIRPKKPKNVIFSRDIAILNLMRLNLAEIDK